MSKLGKSETEKTAIRRAAHGNITAFLERNRGKNQYRHAPSAGWSTNKILRPLSKKFGPGRNALQTHWPQIVGEKWAALSRPVAIRGSKTAKTLHIEAKGPAAALIQANAGQLLGKINQYLGANTITKLSVKHGSINVPHKKPVLTAKPQNRLHEPHVHSSLEHRPENRLQSALDELGRKVNARNL